MCFDVDEDQDEVEEADKSFIGMEALFHLKFGKKIKEEIKEEGRWEK